MPAQQQIPFYNNLNQMVEQLHWGQCRELLEQTGHAVYQWEPLGDLQDAILVDINTGNLNKEDVRHLLEQRKGH